MKLVRIHGELKPLGRINAMRLLLEKSKTPDCASSAKKSAQPRLRLLIWKA